MFCLLDPRLSVEDALCDVTKAIDAFARFVSTPQAGVYSGLGSFSLLLNTQKVPLSITLSKRL